MPLAGGLSGKYIIGKNQPFPFNTLTNAVARLYPDGVAGPVTFLLDDDQSNSNGAPIKITNISGSSAINT